MRNQVEWIFWNSFLSLSFFHIAPGGPYDLSASNKEALTVFSLSVCTACAYDCKSHHKLYQRPQNSPFLPLSIALVTGKGVVNSDSIGQVQPVGDHAPLR